MPRNLLCNILGHSVSRARVRKDGDSYLGRCKRCRTRMVKAPSGDWQLK